MKVLALNKLFKEGKITKEFYDMSMNILKNLLNQSKKVNILYMTNQENNLDNALDMFINAMRLFISTELMREHGDDWERKYFETLYDQQKKNLGR